MNLGSSALTSSDYLDALFWTSFIFVVFASYHYRFDVFSIFWLYY